MDTKEQTSYTTALEKNAISTVETTVIVPKDQTGAGRSQWEKMGDEEDKKQHQFFTKNIYTKKV